eukprot:m.539792 g.539792  ORF g.539792 m.539792 type:complete len:52 (-) comp57635_c0_seq22:1404-1559(-)
MSPSLSSGCVLLCLPSHVSVCESVSVLQLQFFIVILSPSFRLCCLFPYLRT